jgi:predicted O-methyltransferase YrrM
MKHLAARALRKVARTIDPDGIKTLDEFNKLPMWISFANAGWLDKGNQYCFNYCASRLPSDAPVLEIGSFCGLSTNNITYYLRKHGRTNKFFNTDPWNFEGGEGVGKGASELLAPDSDITRQEYRAFVMETFKRNVQFFSRENPPHSIVMASNDFFVAWREGREVADLFGRTVKLGGPLSFAYVDGDHLYEAVHADFVNCDEFLEPGGFILFDDSPTKGDIHGWGVSRVMREVKESGRYELVMRTPNHLFKKLR